MTETRMCKQAFAVFTMSVVCGCAHVADQRAATCDPRIEIAAEIFTLPIVSIGEVHGTQEVPKAIGNIACQFLLKGKSVVVGLEVPASSQSLISEFLNSDGASADRARLFADAFWRTGLRDGRSSTAMFDLLEFLRQQRRAGRNVEVLAFDISAKPQETGGRARSTEASRDQLMADQIDAAIRQHPEKSFLLLSGNFHASRQREFLHDRKFRSMAYLLNQKHPVATFNADFRNGTAWNCRGMGAASIRCEVWPASGAAKEVGVPHMRLSAAIETPPSYLPNFDGTLFVGETVSASPPAAPN